MSSDLRFKWDTETLNWDTDDYNAFNKKYSRYQTEHSQIIQPTNQTQYIPPYNPQIQYIPVSVHNQNGGGKLAKFIAFILCAVLLCFGAYYMIKTPNMSFFDFVITTVQSWLP